MTSDELRKTQKEAIIWMQEFKKSFVMTNKYAQIIQQRMNNLLLPSPSVPENISLSDALYDIIDESKDSKINQLNLELQNNENNEKIHAMNSDEFSITNSTVDFEKYSKPRTAWQLYYTNFCRKYPSLAKTQRGKAKAKLYFNNLDDDGKRHYAQWENWERTKKGKLKTSPTYFHRRTLTVNDFAWKLFV